MQVRFREIPKYTKYFGNPELSYIMLLKVFLVLFKTVMERYFKRKSTEDNISPSTTDIPESSNENNIESILANLPGDPGLRLRISEYDPNIRDQVRRAYLQRELVQPRTHQFPYTSFAGVQRRFNPKWFDDFPTWLEYSISKNAVFCRSCYLFKLEIPDQAGNDNFTSKGFHNWKKKCRLRVHVGGPNSAHNQALLHCEALMNQNQHIQTIVHKQSDQARIDYRTRLNASLDCIRFLLRQGLAFRGHDESEDSSNKAACETTNAIMFDIGDDAFFSVLVDESRDISVKEQMVVVLRYVNTNGQVVERFVGIKHVPNTTAISLKEAIDQFFSINGLSISRLRGQGYDGASNMQGEFNGLKTLILKENESAFYIHCFAHQLQLALVAVAKNHIQIGSFFCLVNNVVTIVGASCKRRDMVRERQQTKVMEAIQDYELPSGQGLNQETSLKRASDTRWGSHYGTLVSLVNMFSSVIEVLEMIVDDGVSLDQRGEADILLNLLQSFDFVSSLFLMKEILGITNVLSHALQKKDLDIVSAMALVKACKQQLQAMRDNGWDAWLDKVSSFCGKHDIDIPDMNDIFVARGRSRRRVEKLTNLHHYRVDLFIDVIDKQLQ
ncbi:uncharacterized protein LOC126590798 isoform X2 [Malus sylvestris]|uniref:uncharacterized protein LOC126590798 isoform X2 n=1 Tax=Malus sylvestris TaxID=3752 RepID=UPI0021ABBBFC|nr:uncharacterized protein LOC126590798 isoform X2 [Malus sylvestris]